jgi:hypothetical protein
VTAETVIKPADLGTEITRHRPERLSIAGAVAAAAVAWLVALGGLVSTISVLPQLGWSRALWVVALCAAPSSALWMTRRAVDSRRIRAEVPHHLLEQRYHGRLEAITDSERRSLRPITATAYEVAARTSELLAELIAIPSVRIFHGVRPVGADLPPIPHAISAGRQLVFVESVAWPPGCYETAENGRIHCDGTYIGQSVRPLIATVGQWRKILPKNHQVSAVIVVHAAGGDLTLPAPMSGDLAWVHAHDAARDIRQRILCGRQSVSRNLVAALIAATADQVWPAESGGSFYPAHEIMNAKDRSGRDLYRQIPRWRGEVDRD